jgi:hypothetical protein
MRIRLYPVPRGKYLDIEFDTNELPCTRQASNGTITIEEIAAQDSGSRSSQATNKQSAPFIKQCTCGKRMATVHLCDECFRDAVTQ